MEVCHPSYQVFILPCNITIYQANLSTF
uniref:Uncharacterized protein n=1 Tax=Arundo donax TaxID=35708 RepID=A0A0A8YT15_ARUDO